MKRMEAIAFITLSIRAMDWSRMKTAILAEDDEGPGIEVCEVTLEEWEHYVRTEEQCIKSTAFFWSNGKVYLVEPSFGFHAELGGRIGMAIIQATGTIGRFLSEHLSTHVESMRLLEPDNCIGPERDVPGAVRPSRMRWGEYHTLKLELGVSRGWPKLERKAQQWKTFPGLQYVFCVRVSHDFKTCQYQLNSVVDGEFETPRAPIVDIGQTPTVTFDSRRLLGLPPDAEVPLGFSEPTLTINLSEVVGSVAYHAEEEDLT